jgi:hypothetical protein
MKRLVTLLLAVGLVAALVGRAGATSFEDELKRLAAENAKAYVTPLSTAFGTCMNSGLYHTAQPHKLLGLDISVKISAALVPDADMHFNFIKPGDFWLDVHNYGIRDNFGNTIDSIELHGNTLYPNPIVSSTIFGPKDTTVTGPDGDAIEAALRAQGASQVAIDLAKTRPEWQQMLASANIVTPPGFDMPGMPLVMPQVSVGLPFKSEVLLRMVPETNVDKVGKVKFLGLGLKHSISQWIPVPMGGIDISGQFSTQKLTVGNLFTSNNTAFNLEVSRRFGFLLLSVTPYAGFGLESSKLKINDYTVTNSTNPAVPNGTVIPGFTLNGTNKSRLTGGVQFVLALLTINADYSIGKYTAYSLGVGLTFR